MKNRQKKLKQPFKNEIFIKDVDKPKLKIFSDIHAENGLIISRNERRNTIRRKKIIVLLNI